MRLLLLSCIVCITLSCQQQLSTSDGIFVLDEKELVEKDFLLSDFIDSMVIILPDTSFLFKEIKEEYIASQYIILNTSEGIATYDRDGKLLYRIGNIGEGQNEYFKNPRIAINKEKSLIYVLSNKRLIIYDFTGKVISNRNINSIIDIPIQIIYQDDNLLLIGREYLSNDSQPIYKWVQMNLENYMTEHIEHGDYKLSHYDKIEGVMSKGYTLNNQARYWSVYNDTIFRIINKGYEIRYLWAKRNERYTYEDTRIPPKSRMCFIPYRICDTDRFLFVNCFNNTISGEKRTLVFDKMNEKFYNSPIIKEDIYGSNIGICFRNYHIINGREYVSATVQSDDLKNKLKQSKNSDALTLRSKIDEEGGELLILMRIKKTAS